uniref:Meiotically up-regulated protein n=1 Tax=Talaromyces marneffei PM1 TaxID=1077442 RepID=A0A093XT13_TALMA
MAQSDGESGRNSPDYPSQIIGATLNGGSSESRRRSGSNDSEVSTPSLADEIFSPSASIVTDITEDYGWETPVKQSVNTSAVLLGKRKEVSDSPVDSDALVSDQIWEGSITVSKPTTPKRLRQIKFWTPELNGHIDLNFRTNPACLIRAIRVSDVGRAIKSTSNTRVSCTEKLDVNQSPPPSASQSIPDITISLPAEHRPDHKEGDADTLPCKSLLLGDDTIQHVLSLLSAQAFSASSPKEQKSREASLSKITPIEIRERLENDIHHCLASTTQGRRCKRTSESDSSQIIRSLDSITKIKCSQVPEYLNDLISTAFCSTTHQRVARKELGNWMVDIEKLCEVPIAVKKTTTSVSRDHRLLALANWIDLLSGGKGLQSMVQPKVEDRNHPGVTSEGCRSLQYFKPYITKKLKNVSVPEALERLLMEPIRKKTEIEGVGIIYVYWQPSNFGHLKIGCTTLDLQKRMKAWSNQCNKSMELYFPNPNDAQELVPVSHIYRVEKLVHMELKNLRRIEQSCPGCRQNHREWFEVSLDLAVEVVRKWMAWMRESPYEKRPGSSDELVLKAEQRRKLKALCEPITGVSVTAQAMEKAWSKTPRQARRLSTGRLPRMRSQSM